MSNCPYLYGKLWAKICKNNNSIYKAFRPENRAKSLIYCIRDLYGALTAGSALELHVARLDPTDFSHDLAENE